MKSDKFAIILAGGEGRRAGGNLPKQFVDLGGKPLVWWSMRAFRDAYPDIELILVVHPGFFDDWDIMFSELPEADRIPHKVICGGINRPASVFNGLLGIRDILADSGDNPSIAIVAIHDGARPIISPALIKGGFDSVERGFGAIPVIESTNSLRRLICPEKSLEVCQSQSVDRSNYVEVQTPQVFYFDEILDANEKIGDKAGFTDDASIAEAAGMGIKLFHGETENIKVTHPIDFAIAKILLNNNRRKYNG